MVRRAVAGFLVTMLFCTTGMAQDRAPYLNPELPIEKRIDDLLSRLTLEEKVSLCHANAIFSTAGVAR